jgi:hypothetical protein
LNVVGCMYVQVRIGGARDPELVIAAISGAEIQLLPASPAPLYLLQEFRKYLVTVKLPSKLFYVYTCSAVFTDHQPQMVDLS